MITYATEAEIQADVEANGRFGMNFVMMLFLLCILLNL
jgi:hypothetical protein